MDSREQYEYHKLLKFLYFEGYADSYEDAAYLLEELSDEELGELLEEYELNEAHTFPLSPEERAIVSVLFTIPLCILHDVTNSEPHTMSIVENEFGRLKLSV